MAEFVTLNPSNLTLLREGNPRMLSYNVEFAEVTGGTFWKAYTPGQIAGVEEFYVEPTDGGIRAMYKDLMQVYPPINLYDEKLRTLAKHFGPVWVRVSGTWATKTYYDFEGKYADGTVPEGYMNVLTRQQWIGVLDFVKAIGAKLLVSVSNCEGLHKAEEPWHPEQAEKLFRLSKEYGVPINAAEFTNEPNMMADTGFPENYTCHDFGRDQDIFFRWVKENYPECLCVGPCTTGGDVVFGKVGGVEQLSNDTCSCDDLMENAKVNPDVFSYHFYNGVSERLAPVVPNGHWAAEEALCEEYLSAASAFARTYKPLRDKYCPGGEMWVTESGDAGGGGNTWASTYMEVVRALNELGGFAAETAGVVFHNTLASSDYGYLQHGSFDPRPGYFAAYLWNALMGTAVYATSEPIREGAHVYCHAYKADPAKKCYLIINNSETETTTVEVPADGTIYTLAGKDGNKRATVMTLNGRDLVLGENWELPDLSGDAIAAGKVELAPMTCTFLVV